jgi:non-heme chloroperoxidase
MVRHNGYGVSKLVLCAGAAPSLIQRSYFPSGWSTAAIAKTWLGEEKLFEDLGKVHVPTLILHGVNDKVCLFPLAMAQHEYIKNSKLIPIESCGHFLFYDQLEIFNKELIGFLEII